MADSTTQSVLFPDLVRKAVVAQFDQEHASSDGGAILLKAADRRLGLIDALATCLDDRREPGKVVHSLRELLGQRIFAIACGYPDANDAARLAEDPILKLLLDRDPIRGIALASQPTLSRFENGVRRGALYRMGEVVFEQMLTRHARRVRRVRHITVDLDVTDDATHGAQQLSFFNGHYGHWCYLPLVAFLTFNYEPDQYLAAAVLRPGNAPTQQGALPLLRRIVGRLQERFPRARILVRLDGGFAAPELFEWLDEVGVHYVVAMAKNAVLERLVDLDMIVARVLSEHSGRTEHVYGEGRYAAQTWDRERRVIYKAEVVRYPGKEPKDNPRFVITNLTRTPRRLYERIYCQRGELENRLKELELGLAIGRTGCSRFWANQLRVLLTAAAYLLMQEVRLKAAATRWARAQVWTLREQLIKLGAHLVTSVRRIVVHLPASYPFREAWSRVAMGLGASPG